MFWEDLNEAEEVVNRQVYPLGHLTRDWAKTSCAVLAIFEATEKNIDGRIVIHGEQTNRNKYKFSISINTQKHNQNGNSIFNCLAAHAIKGEGH